MAPAVMRGRSRSGGGAADLLFLIREAVAQVAKTSPGEFIRQVRSEMSKVVWPSSKETMTTAIMVVMMTAMLAIFFFAVDAGFSAIVKRLLGLLG
jgi:preprotein translocase subunit SecE